MTAQWYFDYISPYAYLQWHLLKREPLPCEFEPRAILFAGLLNYYGHKGPAEIPTKRIHTYRHVFWLAERLDIELEMPRAHPFNPLPVLRATIAAGHDPEFIDDAFAMIWVEGDLPQDDAFGELLDRHDLDPEAVSSVAVKDALRDQTEAAIEQGVFGVPTLVIEDDIFWGVDTTAMARDRLIDPSWFRNPDMDRINDLPEAARR